MNKILLQVLASFVISMLGTSLVLAEQNTQENSYDENFPIPEDGELDPNYTHVYNTYCGMEIGVTGTLDQKFMLHNDIICAPGQLRQLGKNAALTVVGENTTVLMNDHNVICAGDLKNSSHQSSNQMSSIGILLNTGGSKIIGSNNPQGFGTVSGCNVGVEVGYAHSNPQTPANPRAGRNQVKQVQVLLCNAGIRVLNNDNIVQDNKVTCGLPKERYNPIASTEENEPADSYPYPVPGTKKINSDAYVLGIKALTADTTSCRTFDTIPTINRNTLTNNIAQANVNGFVGANEMEVSRQPGEKTNIIRNNIARHNSRFGINILGTGYQVTHNASVHDNGFSGINVTRKRPECGPDRGVLNTISNNKSHQNRNGITAIADFRFRLPGQRIENSGTLFEYNTALDNQFFDLFDSNGQCALYPNEITYLNKWRSNTAKRERSRPTCTLGYHVPGRP
jgi:hypothetical protein